MGKNARRFVAKAEAGNGWRIWNNKRQIWWGQRYIDYPEELLAELNGEKRPERLAELIKSKAGCELKGK
jgi:hypothetical protein